MVLGWKINIVKRFILLKENGLHIQYNPYENNNDIFIKIEKNLKMHMEPHRTPKES
jgi:hypothetical protein